MRSMKEKKGRNCRAPEKKRVAASPRRVKVHEVALFELAWGGEKRISGGPQGGV